MKLTIEQKAKRYDEAIEIARKIKNGEPINAPNGTVIPDVIFPELKEDEDEKIRKWLIGYFNQYIVDDMPQVFSNSLHVKDIISWLEKQGEQKPYERKEFTTIPFGAFDSELIEEMLTIPDGCVATIEGRYNYYFNSVNKEDIFRE